MARPARSALPFEAQRLDDGLVLRRAEAADAGAVVALNVEVFGAQEEPGVGALAVGGIDVEWLVVATGPDAERPGSPLEAACARIPHHYDLDGVAVPGSQIEYVATDERARGRGLVRALFAAHHRRAAEAGELLQIIGGIPFFYRKLGYGYGFDVPPTVTIGARAAPTVDPTRVTVRPGRVDDVDWLLAAESARRRAGLTVVRSRATLETWVARTRATGNGPPWESLLVAELDGRPSGWLRTVAWADEAQLFVLPGAAVDVAVADQLIAHAVGVGGRLADHLGRPVELLASDQPGTPWSRAVHRAGHPRPEPTGYYARTPDELALLRTLRPLLSRRIAQSGLVQDAGEVVVSLYERAVRLTWAGGEVTAVEPAPADQDPFEKGGVGVAPDWFPALVLGRWGARGLVEHTDDTLLGDHAAVMDVLFPARPNDVVTDL